MPYLELPNPFYDNKSPKSGNGLSFPQAKYINIFAP